ncbi:MAG: Nif3-like dinuclear metal center hexameric protein, partial [Clostridia bacterium]
MNSQQLLDELIHFSNNVKSETVDTIKTGAANNELQKVAICFIATPNVIAAAHSWGADLLITHEPTFHNHFDNMIDCDVIKSKNQLIEATGMTIFRFHDHAHYAVPDIIVSGLINTLGWKGDYDGKWRLILKKAKTPRELANDIKTKTQAAHVRMAGAIDTPITKIDLYVGAPGNQPYLDQ